MKRFTALILCICFLFGLTACGRSGQDGSSSVSAPESSGSSSLSSTDESSAPEESAPAQSEASASSEAGTDASSVPTASEVPKDPLPGSPELEGPNGSLIRFTTAEDFRQFTLNAASAEALGDGALRLKSDGGQYQAAGVCTSPTVSTEDFTELTVSWNATLPLMTSVEVEARVKVRQKQADGSEKELWSDWLSWGEYAPGIERSSGEQQGELASIRADVLSTNGSPATAFQLRATLRTSDVSLTPVLRGLYASVRDARGAAPGANGTVPDDINWLVTLQLPSLSMKQCHSSLTQTASVPCALAMMLRQRGETVLPEVIALAASDNGLTSFSNLSYETAFAGAAGYTAYTEYTDLAGLKREIAAENPVGIMLSYAGPDTEGSSLPRLDGASGERTDHMVVLRGFTARNGGLYAVVNDPAAESAGMVRRTYRLDQLMNAWDGRALLLHEKEDANAVPIEKRTLRLRAEDDGYRLYNPDTDTVFSYGERTIFALTMNGQLLSFVQPVHSKLFLLEKSVAARELWVITDLGILYRAEVPAE